MPSSYLRKAGKRHVHKGIDLKIIIKCGLRECGGILGLGRILREGGCHWGAGGWEKNWTAGTWEMTEMHLDSFLLF